MDVNCLKAQEWNVTNVKLDHTLSETNADPCHLKVESAKYDKWGYNGSGRTVVWKGRSISPTSSTGLLCLSPACEFFIICLLNTKAHDVFCNFNAHGLLCHSLWINLGIFMQNHAKKFRWRQLTHLFRSCHACVDLLFLVCVALPWVEQIKKWN